MGVLDNINSSLDIKQLNIESLETLSNELREKILAVTYSNGGHLSSNLGIVETTTALYRTFNFPTDKIIFDVGHQCYAHKILSNRKDQFNSIRLDNGISGFPDSSESEYDAFSAGHAGNSIAASLGLCTARDKMGQDFYVIDIVGDGSIVNGLNLEAITSSTEKPKKLIVILNDNGMSISKNKNGFYKFISKRTSKTSYINRKKRFKRFFGANSFIIKALKSIKDYIKRSLYGTNFFEEYGFKYVGVFDGNDIKEMCDILEQVKTASNTRAVFLHIKTTKGKGLKRAEEQADRYHGVGKDLSLFGGDFAKTLGEALNKNIEKDNGIVAITAGMKDGTGLSLVEQKHPNNFYDVGIAEEYAVTFSAGLAKGGIKPVVSIYSTFLQRAYDQIMHDVCLQNLPVIFCLDRAGLVGEDGKTHQGVYDISYLTEMPNMVVLSPATTYDLENALEYALSLRCPVAIRYSKNAIALKENVPYFNSLWQQIKDGSDLCVLAVNSALVNIAMEYANKSTKSVKVISARSIKPLDEKMLASIMNMPVITLEENTLIGGFGEQVSFFRQNNGAKYKTICLGVKDEFIKHGTKANQLKENGLSVDNLLKIEKEL